MMMVVTRTMPGSGVCKEETWSLKFPQPTGCSYVEAQAPKTHPYLYNKQVEVVDSLSSPPVKYLKLVPYTKKLKHKLVEPTHPRLRIPPEPRPPVKRVPKYLPKPYEPTPYLGKHPKPAQAFSDLPVKVQRAIQRRKHLTPEHYDRIYQQAYLRFLARHVLWTNLVSSRRRKYALALERYYLKLKNYQRYVSMLKYGTWKNVRRKTKMGYPDHPYSRTRTTIWPLAGTQFSRYFWSELPCRNRTSSLVETPIWTGTRLTGCLEGFITPSYAIPDQAASAASALDSANSRALTKVISKINDAEFHIGNILAERQQTIGLLADLIKVITGKHASWVKNRRVSHKYGVKDLASDELAIQYGVLPLISDVYGLADVLAKSMGQQFDNIVVRSVSVANSSSMVKTTVGDGLGNPVYDRTITCDTRVTVSYVVQYRVLSSLAVGLKALGLVNPVEIAWEKMKWSFVLDWLLPIGNWISSWTSDVGVQFEKGTKVVTTTNHYTCTLSGNYPISGYGQDLELNAVGQKTVETKVRTLLTTAPVAPLPRFKNPFASVYHLSAAVALLFQSIGRK